MEDNDDENIYALILLPTRELAIQVYKQFLKFLDAKHVNLKPGLIIGGFSREKQLRIL